MENIAHYLVDFGFQSHFLSLNIFAMVILGNLVFIFSKLSKKRPRRNSNYDTASFFCWSFLLV